MINIKLTAFLPLIILSACTASHVETRFAPGYSERNFRRIAQGMSAAQVAALIGSPLNVSTQAWSEVWYYGVAGRTSRIKSPTMPGAYRYYVTPFRTRLSFNQSGSVEACQGDNAGTELVGLQKEQVIAKLGEPDEHEVIPHEVLYSYTRAGRSGSYKLREVRFDPEGRVTGVIAEIRYD